MRKREKLKFFDILIKRRCYHCGNKNAPMYKIKDYMRFGNDICVCETCANVYHGYKSNVNAYLVETDAGLITEENARKVFSADRIFINHKDPKLNKENALNCALFLTCEFQVFNGPNKTYFYVQSIKDFGSIEKALEVIDTITRKRNCVFYSYAEGIDTSTSEGRKIVDAIRTAVSMKNE